MKKLKKENKCSKPQVQGSITGEHEHSPTPQHGCLPGALLSGSHYAQRSRRNTQCPVVLSIWPGSRSALLHREIGHVTDTKTPGHNWYSQWNYPWNMWAQFMFSFQLNIKVVVASTTFPSMTLPPAPRSATCSHEISTSLQLILNNGYAHLSLSPSPPGKPERC